MVTLLVVEDHELVREGLVQTLRQLEPGVTVYEAADSAGATALLKQGLVFNLMLLDLALPGIDGLSYLRTLRRRYPAMPVVILSAYDDAHTVKKAMNGGAAGFVSKSYSSERLLTALRDTLAGKAFSTGVLPATSVAHAPRPPMGKYAEPSDFGLTERQAEVLGLMAHGKTNRDIAALLDLSEGTVKVHLTAIFKALGVASRTQAMVVIARRGIRL
jgi:DNA-binding NarL/FixJ family response regulator